MEQIKLIILISIVSFLLLSIILYYFDYISVFNYIICGLVMVNIIMYVLIKLYGNKGIECPETHDTMSSINPSISELLYKNFKEDVNPDKPYIY